MLRFAKAESLCMQLATVKYLESTFAATLSGIDK
jgi:hypothetical protein